VARLFLGANERPSRIPVRIRRNALLRTVLLTVFFIGTIGIPLVPVSMAQNQSSLEIHVESNEVVVPVFVLDKTHFRREVDLSGEQRLVELDQEITGLTAKNFHIFDDGVEQHIQTVTVERERAGYVSDNVSHHMEYSCTPRGVWACTDLETMTTGQGYLHMYVISYQAPASTEGSCHRIKVKVDHRPKATVYARDEYCRVQHLAFDPLLGTKLGKQLEDYAISLEEGKIPLSVQESSFYSTTAVSRVDLAVDFPWKALRHESGGCFMEATVNILGLAFGKDGTLAARFSDMACFSSGRLVFFDYNEPDCDLLRLPPDPRHLPTRYETQFDLAPGEYSLKVVIADGQKFGRMEMPIKVGSYDRNNLEISDIVLCKRFRKAVSDVPGWAAQYIPFASNGFQFTPTGDTRFAKSDHLIAYFEIYEPLLTDALSTSVRFQMRITDEKTGEVKTDTGLRPADSFVQQGKTFIPIAEQVAITELPSGNYRLEVQATDSTGNKTEWRTTSFTVD